MRVYAHKSGGVGRPAYFYIHGGGFIMGSPEFVERSNKNLALELGCVVVAVAYRLAPETAFPGNVEDCYAALKWLHAYAVELGVDASRVAVGGESAGGGLAAALALLARDRGAVDTGTTAGDAISLIQQIMDARAGAFGK